LFFNRSTPLSTFFLAIAEYQFADNLESSGPTPQKNCGSSSGFYA
jgi:hypothetical protein